MRNNAIAVPQVAVLDGPQGKFVYVAGKDKDGKDIAVVRPVTLGDWVAGRGQNLWIVESGLEAGDHVIVDGIAKLQPGAPIELGGGAPPAGAPGAARCAAAARSLPTPPQGRQIGAQGLASLTSCSRASSSTGRSSRP